MIRGLGPRGRRTSAFGVGLIAAAGLAAAGVSLADTQSPDGDTTAQNGNLKYGVGDNARSCTEDRAGGVAGVVTLVYRGNGTHLTPGRPVTLTLTPPAGSGITATQTEETTVPASFNSNNDSFGVPFKTFVPATTYDGTYHLDVSASDGLVTPGGDDADPNGRPQFNVIVNCGVVAANNVAPTVQPISGSASVLEGSSGTYSVSAGDTDLGDTLSYSWSLIGSGGVIHGSPSGSSVVVDFLDGPNDLALSVDVSDGHGHVVTRTLPIAEANVAPAIGIDGGGSVDEGSAAHTYTYTVADPGADTQSKLPADLSCGALGGTPQSVVQTDAGGHFDCVFPDGAIPATTSSVSATSTDSDGAEGNVATLAVTVNDVAPTTTLVSGATTVDESTAARHYSYTIDDPGQDTVQSVAADCGTQGTRSNATNTDASGSFDCTFLDGRVPAQTSTVSVAATDSDGLAGSPETKAVTVDNVAPAVSGLVLGNATGTACLGGTPVTASYSFGDAGINDFSWVPSVNWGDSTTDASYTGTGSQPGTFGPFTHTYIGAGSWTVTAKVTDKDGDTGSAVSPANAVKLLYSTGQGILQPINYTGPRSLFKLGSTIPVKVRITDCKGNPVSGLAPQVSLKYMDASADATAAEDVYSTVPDQGTTMRYTGSPDYQYIYNLGTKGRLTGSYTVTVSDPTIAPIPATFDIKK